MKDAKIIEDLKKYFERVRRTKQSWDVAKFTCLTFPYNWNFIGLLFSTGLAIILCIVLLNYLTGLIKSVSDLAALTSILCVMLSGVS